MFKKLPDGPKQSARLTVRINGTDVDAHDGETVASVMLRVESAQRRTPVSGSRRAPFCMMGVCFDCLVVVDGVSSTQGCLVPVRDGMRIDRQDGMGEVSS